MLRRWCFSESCLTVTYSGPNFELMNRDLYNFQGGKLSEEAFVLANIFALARSYSICLSSSVLNFLRGVSIVGGRLSSVCLGRCRIVIGFVGFDLNISLGLGQFGNAPVL